MKYQNLNNLYSFMDNSQNIGIPVQIQVISSNDNFLPTVFRQKYVVSHFDL